MTEFDRSKSFVETICVCGQQVFAGTLKDGDPAIIHKLPMCSDFDRLEPDDFLAWLRHHKESRKREST